MKRTCVMAKERGRGRVREEGERGDRQTYRTGDVVGGGRTDENEMKKKAKYTTTTDCSSLVRMCWERERRAIHVTGGEWISLWVGERERVREIERECVWLAQMTSNYV